jgi:hypothetical protein
MNKPVENTVNISKNAVDKNIARIKFDVEAIIVATVHNSAFAKMAAFG